MAEKDKLSEKGFPLKEDGDLKMEIGGIIKVLNEQKWKYRGRRKKSKLAMMMDQEKPMNF